MKKEEVKNVKNTFIAGEIETTLVNSKGRKLELKDFAMAFSNNSKVTYYDDERCLNQTCRIVSLSEDSITIASNEYQYDNLSFDEIISIVSKTTQQIIDEDYSNGLTLGQIIPKEEPKQEDWVFERSSGYSGYRNKITGNWIYQTEYIKFFNQPKQEQDKNKFSEEDILEAFRQGQDNVDYSEMYGFSSKLTEQEWFEQFKNK